MRRIVPAVADRSLPSPLQRRAATRRRSTADWLHVLHHKKAAVAPNARRAESRSTPTRSAHSCSKHRTHSRAREVYQHIQLDFARELPSLGRYQDAIRFYRAVLAHDPAERRGDAAASADAVDRLAVSREKLLALEKGMSQHEVAQLLGKPIPGLDSPHTSAPTR